VIDDLTDFRYLLKDILSSGQSVIGDLTDFRYPVKDIVSSGQSVIGDLTDFRYLVIVKRCGHENVFMYPVIF
jgi:hypothetical protein